MTIVRLYPEYGETSTDTDYVFPVGDQTFGEVQIPNADNTMIDVYTRRGTAADLVVYYRWTRAQPVQ